MKLSKPTFKIIRYASKTLTDGSSPLVIRVTYSRKRKYFSLGMSAFDKEWNNEHSRYTAKRLNESQRKANLELNAFDKKLADLEKYFNDVDFTFARFEQKMFQSTDGNVLIYFDAIISQLEKENRLGSVRMYRSTRDKLKKFKKEFVFRDIDKKFLERFEAFTLKTCSQATAGIYLRTLRAAFNSAISENLVKREIYPFTEFKIKTVRGRKKALSKDQLESLKTYQPKGLRLADSLKLFLFSYYARGMNLTDMASLTWENIRNNRIYYQRQKTTDPIDLLIDDNLAQIIADYSNNEKYIFGILEPGLSTKTIRYRIHGKLKKINEDLRTIASDTGLPSDISFYWARHSYATILKRAGVSISVIQETLGHSSEAVTKNYLDSFETNQLDEISKHL